MDISSPVHLGKVHNRDQSEIMMQQEDYQLKWVFDQVGHGHIYHQQTSIHFAKVLFPGAGMAAGLFLPLQQLVTLNMG